LFLLTKTMKSKGLIALEAHIEKPSESRSSSVIPDLQRSLRAGFHLRHAAHDDHEPGRPPSGRTAMEKQLEKHHHEALVGANALQSMADGLPALGIVAAVLGVIKTMGAISEPPKCWAA